MTFSELSQKKVVGIPVLYLAAAAVTILAIVAWRMKAAPKPDEPTAEAVGEDAILDENGLADGTNPYAGYAGNGTVIVAPTPPVAEVVDDGPDTNEEWVREGAEWLVAKKDVRGEEAYNALSKYLDGKQRSIQESQWVNWVIQEKGYPPDSFTETAPTTTTPTPATAFGYRGYGWYKADGKLDATKIAAKYKIPVTQYYTWNPSLPRIPKKGTYVKVRANSNPLTGYKG